MLQAPGSLALGDHQRPLVGLGHVAGHPGGVVPAESPAAVGGGAVAPVAQGGELGVGHQLPDLIGGVHLGDDQTHGPGVQHFQDLTPGDGVDPHQGAQPRVIGGGHQLCGGARSHRAVLQIHDHIVQSRLLHGPQGRGGQQMGKGAHARLPGVEFVKNDVVHLQSNPPKPRRVSLRRAKYGSICFFVRLRCAKKHFSANGVCER